MRTTRYWHRTGINKMSVHRYESRSAVDFSCWRLAVDFDRRRSIEEEKGKREEEKKKEVPSRCPCLRALAACRSTASRRPRALAARGSPARRCRPCNPRAAIVPARGDETSPRAGRETEVTSPR
ncbi:hypothetical protein GW17_00047224 [Ensete ventricosum]|nr:hypothetical protein GW17_00047224 [Ensete ventricosum]